jgi:hypothetical protein
VGEDRGKFLYDVVMARLSSQAADLAAMGGRAKDLLGVATISTTITGAIANGAIVTTTKHNVSWLVFAALIVGFVLVLGAAGFSLWPRTWYLSPEPLGTSRAVQAHLDWPLDAYYGQIAVGFIAPDVVTAGKSALEHNDQRLMWIGRAILIEMAGLLLLALAGFALAYEAVAHS